jgi:hypothetical protein
MNPSFKGGVSDFLRGISLPILQMRLHQFQQGPVDVYLEQVGTG